MPYEIDALIEMADMATEAALDELAAFGCIEFECGTPWTDWAELDDDPSADFAFDCFAWDYDEDRLPNPEIWGARSIDLYELF